MKNLFTLRLFSICLLIFAGTLLIAQTETQDTTKPIIPQEETIVDPPVFQTDDIMVEEEEPVYVDMDTDIEFVSTDQSIDPNVNAILSNPKFQITNTGYNDYRYFSEKYSDTYNKKKGVIGKGRIILPMIFLANSYTVPLPQIELTLGNRKGLFNLETEKWDVPLKYKSFSKLDNYLIAADMNGKYGVITKQGDVIIDFDWTSFSGMSSLKNYAMVNIQKGSKSWTGILSMLTRKLVVPCEYESISTVASGSLFLVKKNGKFNLMNINNETQFKHWYDDIRVPSGGRNLFIVKKDNRYGIIDINEKAVVKVEFLNIERSPFSDGSYFAQNKKGKFGCMTLDGTITLPFEYDDLVRSSYSGARNNILATQNNKCGIVRVNDGLPYELVTCDFDSVTPQQKIFIVKKKGKYGVLDLYGKEVISIDRELIKSVYLSAGTYSRTNFLIIKSKKKYDLYNDTGMKVSVKSYMNIDKLPTLSREASYYSTLKYNYFKVTNDKGEVGMMDALGQQIIEPMFDDIEFEYNDKICVKKGNKLGVYDLYTKKIVLAYEYDDLIKVKNGFIGFKGKEYHKINFTKNIFVKKL